MHIFHYNWHRFYDPETGRYLSADPIGLDGGINLYTYTSNNPINAVDPMGLFAFHGNWCGPDHTGGYSRTWNDLTEGERRNALPPKDGMDSCCQDHDRCYGKCRDQYPCDEEARADCFRLCDRALDYCANNEINKTGMPLTDGVMQNYFGSSVPGPGSNGSTCPQAPTSSRPPASVAPSGYL